MADYKRTVSRGAMARRDYQKGGSSGRAYRQDNSRYNNSSRSSAPFQGAKFGSFKKGSEVLYYVTAWRKTRGGFMTLSAFQNTKWKTSETKTESGKVIHEWIPMIATITNKTTMQTSTVRVLLDATKNRLYIKDFGEIVTDTRGGYWGRGGYKM